MLQPFSDAEVGSVMVHTTANRGHSAEELADMAVDKLIHVGGSAPAPIRDQALAYKERVREVMLFYIRQAMLSERTTMLAEIKETI
jgi:hypothetical protein